MNLIDRDALLESFSNMECIDHNTKRTTVAFGNGVRWMLEHVIPEEINKAPAVVSACESHATWILSHRGSDCFCSKCMRISFSEYNFCPNCGAVMDGGAR